MNPAIDRLSFTLPDVKSAVKKRIKKPRKPDPLHAITAAVMGFLTILNTFLYVINDNPGSLICAVGTALCTSVCLRAAWSGKRTIYFQDKTYVAGMIVQIVALPVILVSI